MAPVSAAFLTARTAGVTPERFQRLAGVLARRQPDLTVVMEGVHKPHNLSAVLRSADAAGVFRVHAVSNTNAFGVSHGASGGSGKWVEVVRHETTSEVVVSLKTQGFQVVAAHGAEGSTDFRQLDYTVPTAFLVGAELFGVSTGALRLADHGVRIPMVGMVESLNVSVATALLLFEAMRQREAAGLYDECRIDPGLRARTLFEWAYPRISRRLRERALPYPALSDDGELQDPSAFRRLLDTGSPD